MNCFIPRKSLLALAAAALAAQPSGPALAQAARADSQSNVPEIRVYATPEYVPEAAVGTKSDTPAREVPFATSTVGRTLLQDRGVTSMNEALRSVPGVNAINGIGNFNARYRFRGFLATSQLKDGFRQLVNFPVTEFQNVETLEVLRGQASTLYGRFEPGGVLNIVTKRPGVNIREVGLSVGDDGQRRLTGDIGGRIGENVAYRINAVLEDSETFRDFVGNRTNFIAPSFQFKLGGATTFDVRAEYLTRNGAFDRGFPLALNVPILSLPADRFLGDPQDRFSNESLSMQFMLTHRFANGIELRAGHAYNRGRSNGDYFFPTGTNPLISNAGVLSRRNQITADLNQDRTSMVEAKGKFMLGGIENKWLAGFEQSRSFDDSRIDRSTVNSLLNIYNPVYNAVRSPTTAVISNTEAANENSAFYLQNEALLSQQWRITLGARNESVDSYFFDRATNVRRTSSASALTWRGGVSWMPAPSTVVFASYSESFSPEVTARGLVGGVDAVPSRGKQWEGGVRFDLFDPRLQFTATAFDITRTNVRVADVAVPALDRQVGEQRSRGLEFEVSGRITERWQVVGSYTTMEARVTQDTAALTDKRFNGVPANSGFAWTRYDFNRWFALGGGITYVGDRFVDPANTFTLPAFTRYDLAAYGEVNKHLRWQLNVINLTNKNYFENGNTTSNFYPGQPRTVRLAFTAKF
jgi:iron complex outermembrane recepter protein